MKILLLFEPYTFTNEKTGAVVNGSFPKIVLDLVYKKKVLCVGWANCAECLDCAESKLHKLETDKVIEIGGISL